MRVLLVTCGLLGHRAFHTGLVAGLREAAPHVEMEDLTLDRVLRCDPLARWVVRLWGTGRVPWPGVRSKRLGCERALSLAAARGVRRSLRRRPARVVHLHTQAVAHGLARRRWPPAVISFDATAAALRGSGAWVEDAAAFAEMHAAEKDTFAAAARAVAWSTWARGGVEGPCSSALVIPPGVDTRRFRPGEAARAGLVFVGNDFVRKGGLELLEAWSLLAEPKPDLHLVTHAQSLPPLSSGIHVHRGLTPGDSRLVELLQRAALFVLPTREECFGIAFTEALACGTPCVGTTVMAVPEIIRESVNGVLVPPRAPDRLAATLDNLLHDATRRSLMERNARADALARFDAAHLAQRWAELYRETGS